MEPIKIYRSVIIIDIPLNCISQEAADFLYENGREYSDLQSNEDLYTTFNIDIDELKSELSSNAAKEIEKLNDLLDGHNATFFRFTVLNDFHDGK